MHTDGHGSMMWLTGHIMDLRDRVVRLEMRVEAMGQRKRREMAWLHHLPWWRIMTFGPMVILGLLGHLSPAEWKSWLLSR